ncbi:MAG: pilus assembly protein PilX [Rubrivivax sp.]|nr:MAG: pilus assembly protein PilX [Rubrivivax sp.]
MNPYPCQTMRRQRGASLIFALITLVALMLASVALVRSVDSGAKILGNIAFQKDATVAANQATQAAIAWLRTATDLTIDGVNASGYYASTPAGTNIDVTGFQAPSDNARALVDWDRISGSPCAYATASTYASCAYSPSDPAITVNGNTARYVIFRVCQAAGATSSTNCAQPLSGAVVEAGGGAGGDGLGDMSASVQSKGQYYRIVVRVVGARDTVSFTETLVQF